MGRTFLVPILIGSLCVALALAGCRPPKPPLTVVRDFHIALILDDEQALAESIAVEGATTPATDMRLLRDLMVYFVRTQPVTDPKMAPKFVDSVCSFALEEGSVDREEVQVYGVVNFSQLLVPFLGSAARGVTGMPKDIIRYSVFLRKIDGHYKVTRVDLPYEKISDIGSRFKVDTTQLGKTPEELAKEAEAARQEEEAAEAADS